MKRLRACGALIAGGGPAGLMPAIALAGAEQMPNNSQPSAKKVYVRPELITLGDVRKLTQGGVTGTGPSSAARTQ